MAHRSPQRRHSSEESVANSQTDSEADESSESSQHPHVFVDDSTYASSLAGFNDLYIAEQLFDMKLCVDGEEFHCHKVLLAASSEYFRTMFTINLSEKDKNEVTINGVDRQTMLTIIRYLYTRRAQLTTDTVQNLLSAANLFQLSELRDGCATFMARKLDNDNCIGIHFFAQAHDCIELQLAAKDMITENFTDVLETTEFLEMTTENLQDILHLDELRAHEEDIFEAIVAWLDHMPDDRTPHVYSIMSLVRFVLMDEYFLYDHVKGNQYLQSEPRMVALVDEVIKYKLLKNRWEESDLTLEPRFGQNFTRVIVYNEYINDESRQVLQVYGQRADGICRVGNLGLCDLPAENPAALVTGEGDLYIAGGDDGADRFLKWLQEESVFEDCSSMPVGRKQFCLVQADKLIYAIGGSNADGNLSRVDCYNEEEDDWKNVTPLPRALRCFCAVSYNGKLYVFGGETEKISKKVTRGRAELSKQTFCYSPHNNKWMTLADMRCARGLAGCTVYKNKIYVIGGFGTITDSWIKDKSPENCLASVEVYDPQNNTWTAGPDLPIPLCGMGVVKYRSTICVLGGEDDNDVSTAVYCLNKDNSGWDRQEDMLMGMSEVSVHSSYCVMNISID